MALKRMDNVGIVVDDLGETIDFFRELGLELEGRATIEGECSDCETALSPPRYLKVVLAEHLKPMPSAMVSTQTNVNPGYLSI